MAVYEDEIRTNARLVILKALAAEHNESLHSGFLAKQLMDLMIDRPREWLHSELDWLAEIGAVTLLKPAGGSVWIATLTEKGARHLRRSIIIEGIDRPSRPGV